MNTSSNRTSPSHGSDVHSKCIAHIDDLQGIKSVHFHYAIGISYSEESMSRIHINDASFGIHFGLSRIMSAGIEFINQAFYVPDLLLPILDWLVRGYPQVTPEQSVAFRH